MQIDCRYGLACGYGLTYNIANAEGFLTEPPSAASPRNLIRRRRSQTDVEIRASIGRDSYDAETTTRCSSVADSGAAGSISGAELVGDSCNSSGKDISLDIWRTSSWRVADARREEWTC